MKEKEKKYLDNSILKPYLIHVEFELENILSTIKKDNFLRNIYTKKGYDMLRLENDLRQAIHRLETLQSIFRYSINNE